ncbi:MAG: hypothetical protein GXP31_10555 [Kiritimatiellaeota bacterium]|nr:hypothetical protein [Kiritimatiellota bacterium]
MDTREDIRELIHSRSQEVETPDQVVHVYRDLFETVWRSTEPVLGSVTTAALMQNAVEAVRASHPFVEELHVTGSRILVGEVRGLAAQMQPSEIRDALDAVIARFLDSVGMLTGDILARRLDEVLRRKSH